MKTVTVVIPALNEKGGIERTIRAIPRGELRAMGYDTDVLVVDGNSRDGTADLARRAGARVITEPKRGYGLAYKTGFVAAKGEIIVTADADGTYPVDEIPELLRILERDRLDFISGNRFARMEKGAMPLINRVGNLVLSWVTRLLFGLRLRDPESGMWVFRRDALDNLRLRSDDFRFSHELKLEACYFSGRRWKEVPIRYRARQDAGVKLTGGWRSWTTGFSDLFHIVWLRIGRTRSRPSR